MINRLPILFIHFFCAYPLSFCCGGAGLYEITIMILSPCLKDRGESSWNKPCLGSPTPALGGKLKQGKSLFFSKKKRSDLLGERSGWDRALHWYGYSFRFLLKITNFRSTPVFPSYLNRCFFLKKTFYYIERSVLLKSGHSRTSFNSAVLCSRQDKYTSHRRMRFIVLEKNFKNCYQNHIFYVNDKG